MAQNKHTNQIFKYVFLKTSGDNNFPWGPILFGLIFPVIAWILEFILHNYPVTLLGLMQMHRANPVLYIIDLAPVFLGLVGKFLVSMIHDQIKDQQELIGQKDQIIRRNAQIAKKIGDGDLAFSKEDIAIDDELGNALFMMRDKLLTTKLKENEQGWIAAGKEKISNVLRLHTDINELAYDTLVNLINYVKIIQGAFYIYDEEQNILINISTYAYNRRKYINQEFRVGQGLIGQAAYEKGTILRREIPEDYVTITSGIIGDQKPASILIVPLLTDGKLQGALEFASFKDDITGVKIKFIEELSDIIARTIFNLKVNTRTEKLLHDAQKMTEELQENEEELRQNAEEMRATQEELEKSNAKLAQQVQEVENAQKRLHSLLENASEIISIYDENLKLVYESPSVTSILGYTPEEMMEGKDIERLTNKGEADLKEMFQMLIENSNEPQTIQYTYMKKDGKKIFIEATGRNLLHDPAINGVIINSRDITERKRAEKEERMKSKMQSLSENSPDMIIRLSPTGQFFYANPIVKIFTGIDTHDLLKKTIDEVNFSEQITSFFKETSKHIAKTQEKMNTEVTFPTNFGERIMQVNGIPEFNEERELESILFVAHDITERKNIELEIQKKNKNITESINYAERIQSSILPDSRYIQEFLPKSFIFYKPRDVVSGDFPWFFKKDDDIYIAAVDCTGHGVPGALLSFIAYFLLNNIVDHDYDWTAGEVLDHLHMNVRRTLKQDRADANARDGMDIALVKINLVRKKLQYSGAHRPLYLMRKNELSEFDPNRKAIGGIPHAKKPEKNFVNHAIDILEGDKIFFFSDGLTDQLGGPDREKYQAKRVREAIIENSDFSMTQFSNFFVRDFKKWKGENKQIDDVLLLGIEF